MDAEAKDTARGVAKPYLATPHGILFQGDCLDLLAALDRCSIDAIFADPPFNLGKNYGEDVVDSRSDREYLEWTNEWISQAVRVLKPGGAFFFYNIPRHCIPAGEALSTKHGMRFQHWIAIMMKNTYPRGKSLYPAHYALLYYTKGEPKTFMKLRTPIPTCRHCGKDIRDYGGHRSKLNPKGLNLTDFWEDTSPVRHRKFKKRPSNELKPMIPERCILMSTFPHDLVLDPFGGGGSSYEVAELRHRRWLGIEIADCLPIQERLEEAGVPCSREIDKNLEPMEWVRLSEKLLRATCAYEPPDDEIGLSPLNGGPPRQRRRHPTQLELPTRSD